jgi:hypothetical protein
VTAQLFYRALACLGLFIGARRVLGRFGGLAAVGLYCSSGAALLFAWRDYMPTFTDASLIAAGSGTLLWALLATEASARRRTRAGLAGFAAIEIAAFVRYTDIVILGCAAGTVIAAWRLGAARLPLPRCAGGLPRSPSSAPAWPLSMTWSTAARSRPGTRPVRSRSASATPGPICGTCPRT